MIEVTKPLIRGILNPSQIHKTLQQSSWSLKTLFEGREVPIEPQTIINLCKLSGLNEDLTENSRVAITRSLQQQIKFIEHLYDQSQMNSQMALKDEKLARTFRLIQSDHQPNKPLTLADIEAQITALQPLIDKGEIGEWPVVPKGKGSNSRTGGEVFTVTKK